MEISESSGFSDSPPDMNSSAEIEMISPDARIAPRKLTFYSSPEDKMHSRSPKCIQHPNLSPPYRKVRALR